MQIQKILTTPEMIRMRFQVGSEKMMGADGGKGGCGGAAGGYGECGGIGGGLRCLAIFMVAPGMIVSQ